MSVNINANKYGAGNPTSSRTPQISIGGPKQAMIDNSVFSTRKQPVLKHVKKIGAYKRNRPPLYEREIADTNASSLPVIINSLSISQKQSSESQSPELIKRYELKGRVLKPAQRFAHLRSQAKVVISISICYRMHQKAYLICLKIKR